MGNATTAALPVMTAVSKTATASMDWIPISGEDAESFAINCLLRFTARVVTTCGRELMTNQRYIGNNMNDESMFVRREGGDGQEEFEVSLNELSGENFFLKDYEYVYNGVRYEAEENFQTNDKTFIKHGDIIVIVRYQRNKKGEGIILVDLERAGHSNRTWDQPKEIKLHHIHKMKRRYALWKNDIVQCSQEDGNYEYGVVICSYPLAIKLCTEFHDNTISPRFYKYIKEVTEDIENQQRALMNVQINLQEDEADDELEICF